MIDADAPVVGPCLQRSQARAPDAATVPMMHLLASRVEDGGNFNRKKLTVGNGSGILLGREYCFGEEHSLSLT